MWVGIPPPAGVWNELFHGVLNMIIKICIKRDDIMILKLTSKKKLLLTLCCIVFTLGLSITIQLKEAPTILSIDPHSSIPFAHAADGEGCSKCHSTPITGHAQAVIRHLQQHSITEFFSPIMIELQEDHQTHAPTVHVIMLDLTTASWIHQTQGTVTVSTAMVTTCHTDSV